jgi:hypothetical protein
MATATNTPPTADWNARLADAGRRASILGLDTYEKTVETVAAWERRVAQQAPNETVSTLLSAHADLSRDLAKAYTAAARDLVN